MKKIMSCFFVVFLSCTSFFGATAMAESKLNSNELQIKADRIEQENTGNKNTETTATDKLFDEEQMAIYEALKKNTEKQTQAAHEQLFLQSTPKVDLYKPDNLFLEEEQTETLPTTQKHLASSSQSQTAKNTQSVIILMVIGLAILTTGTIISISTYRKGV